jgi:hypothetical protein
MTDLSFMPIQNRKVIVTAGQYAPKAKPQKFLFRIQPKEGSEMKNRDEVMIAVSGKREIT